MTAGTLHVSMRARGKGVPRAFVISHKIVSQHSNMRRVLADACRRRGYHAFAMGNGDHGRLGTGEMRSALVPTRVLTPQGAGVLSVAAGGAHSLILLEGVRLVF